LSGGWSIPSYYSTELFFVNEIGYTRSDFEELAPCELIFIQGIHTQNKKEQARKNPNGL